MLEDAERDPLEQTIYSVAIMAESPGICWIPRENGTRLTGIKSQNIKSSKLNDSLSFDGLLWKGISTELASW